MPSLRLLLGDQLSESISSLQGIDQARDVILIAEAMQEATYVKHHRKKIAFLFSAMRHFAEELRAKGFNVRYVKLDDADNTGNITGEVKRALTAANFERVIVTEPGEYRLLQAFKTWSDIFSLPVEIRPDARFLCSLDEFNQWAKNKKQLRMEYFYREMRKKHRLLLEPDGKPCGGQWNYDNENRKPPVKGLFSPKRISHQKSAITRSVLELVNNYFSGHFGSLKPFHFAVTRAQALLELEQFIEELLPYFGDYQDAMVTGEPYLYHSLLSCYLNAGLLLPLEICRMAEAAYRARKAPLNAVEGFIRQILGWREFVRGIYWMHMPGYGQMNFLEASRPLPEFYWTGQTSLFCIAEAVRHTRDHAYSHRDFCKNHLFSWLTRKNQNHCQKQKLLT